MNVLLMRIKFLTMKESSIVDGCQTIKKREVSRCHVIYPIFMFRNQVKYLEYKIIVYLRKPREYIIIIECSMGYL